ncbi:MAG: hypothetical protein ACYC1D_17850, partial [Acidimicrobiales bacterium]
MALTDRPIAALIRRVDTEAPASARRAIARWARVRPALADWEHPGHLAAACRAAPPELQDRLLTDVLAVAAGDTVAQLTVLAGLAGRLSAVVAGWARAGVGPVDLAGMEADLVAEA